MKYIWLLIISLVHSSRGEFNNKVLQTFESAIGNLTVSPECNRSLTLYIDNILSGDEDPWALRMLDATSKIPVGLLYSYNFGEMGDFNECLGTESKDGLIKAKYCLGVINIEAVVGGIINGLNPQFVHPQQQAYLRKIVGKHGSFRVRDENDGDVSLAISPTWAICLPSDCTNEDVKEILSTLIGSESAVCQTKEDLTLPLTKKAIATIVILSIFGFLLVASTIYDLYCNVYKQVPSSALYVAFSVYTNGKKLFKINKNSTELSCLNGIRFISMLWVIIGHVFLTMGTVSPLTNFQEFLDWADTLRSMAIANGTLSVDSFFVIGGVLVMYVFIKARHNGVKFNLFQFYLHRYLRLTPPLAVVILVSATLLEYMGTGPLWMLVKSGLQEPCQKYWWSSLLYIQNYVNIDELCVSQTWYLNIDMQLYIISPLFLFPLLKWPKTGICFVICAIIAFIISPFYVAFDKELSAIITNFYPKGDSNDYQDYYYMKTHTRAAPYFMGLLLGYMLATIKFKRSGTGRAPIKINKILVYFLWIASLAVMLTCIYGGHSTLRKPEYYRVANAFYIGLVRPTWSLCLGWVIFACILGYGGPINWLLSLPIYQVLNRFTYCLYILHASLLTMTALASKRGKYFSEFDAAYSFWGIYMLTFGLSVPWILAFESPVIIIEKFIFRGTNRLMDITGRLVRKKTQSNPKE